MDKNVTTIFLSMALTIAFTRMVGTPAPGPTLAMWGIFAYFMFRKVSYYVSDMKFLELSSDLFRPETVTERMLNLFFGVAALFLFIVTGYFVSEPDQFFLWSAFTLLVNIMWLVLLCVLVDPAKDKNPRLTIRGVFRNYIIINCIEIPIFLIAGLWLHFKWDWRAFTFQMIEPWIIGLALGILAFIMLIDFLLHKYFLFDPNYKCE